MSKKLYEVEVSFIYYAYAEDEFEACEHVEEAAQACLTGADARAVEVTHNRWPLAADWDDRCLVYHNGGDDIELRTLLNKLPARGGR